MAQPKRKPPKASKRNRELQNLLKAEHVLRELLKFSRPTQNYDFLRDPLMRITTEREVLQMAEQGDPVAVQMRRARRDA